VVGFDNSTCSACGRGADHTAKRHDETRPWPALEGKPACGKKFTGIAIDTASKDRALWAKNVRPDLKFKGVGSVVQKGSGWKFEVARSAESILAD
jgi:hypothetical protein